MPFPRSTAPSIASPSLVDTDHPDPSRRNSVSPAKPATSGDSIGDTAAYNRVPLTKASLDLMDMPIPSGVLAEEFAYHGLAPSFLKERHSATVLLDQIYTAIKRFESLFPDSALTGDGW
jgi:hypothetical protein